MLRRRRKVIDSEFRAGGGGGGGGMGGPKATYLWVVERRGGAREWKMIVAKKNERMWR